MNMITFSKGMKTNNQHSLPESEYEESYKKQTISNIFQTIVL